MLTKTWAHYVSAYVVSIEVGQIIAWLAATKWPNNRMGEAGRSVEMDRDPQWWNKSWRCSWKTIFHGYAKHLPERKMGMQRSRKGDWTKTHLSWQTMSGHLSSFRFRSWFRIQIQNQIRFQRHQQCPRRWGWFSWWRCWWAPSSDCSFISVCRGAWHVTGRTSLKNTLKNIFRKLNVKEIPRNNRTFPYYTYMISINIKNAQHSCVKIHLLNF